MEQKKPIVIILGAGASHDYVNPADRPPNFLIPPITNEIIDNKFLLRIEGFSEYSDALDAISYMAPWVKPPNSNSARKTLEECMNEFPSPSQQIAFKFFIKDLFESISESSYWHINNYKALKDRIVQGGFRACIATFNYDTLLEKSMGVDWEKLDEYIQGDIAIIKLHGSCNWSYVHERNTEDEKLRGIKNSFDYLKISPDTKIGKIYTDKRINKLDPSNKYHRFPIIAIPTTSTKEFVCPQNHLDILANFLHATDKILIIGWKAGDSQFINFLEKNIEKQVSVGIVNGTGEGIRTVREKLSHIKKLNLDFIHAKGFSNFIGGNESLTFFGE